MKICVSPVGLNLKAFEIDVNGMMTGNEFIEAVKDFCGEKWIKLLFKGRNVVLDKSLAEQGIGEGSKVVMMKGEQKKNVVENVKKETGKINEVGVVMKEETVEEDLGPVESIVMSEVSLGNVYVWGSNASAKLGISDCEGTNIPTLVKFPYPVEITSIACGSFHTVALDIDGHLYYWGRCLYLKDDNPKFCNKSEPWKIEEIKNARFTKISAGTGHSLALDTKGDVWSWGEGLAGQLGHGVLDNEYYPKPIEELNGFRFIDISAGGQHSVCITKNEEVIVWGRNQAGQLGIEDKKDRITPTIVLNFKASQVKCGIWHTVWVVGKSLYLSGNTQSVPKKIAESFSQYQCGGCNTVIYTDNAEIITINEELQETYEQVYQVKQIACTDRYTLLLVKDGTILGKGDNKQGQLGCGDNLTQHSWVHVKIPFIATKISCGTNHACAIIESQDLASCLSKAYNLPYKDVTIFCYDGSFEAHRLLLNSHTKAHELFDIFDCNYQTSLIVKHAEIISAWLYSGKIPDNILNDDLDVLYYYCKNKNCEFLADKFKQIKDLRTSDEEYRIIMPEYKAQDKILKMTQEEMKLKGEFSSQNARNDEDHEVSNDERDDEEMEIARDDEEDVEEEEMGGEIEKLEVQETAEERRRKVLEAFERRNNNG
ncbi:hypothetical protein SteCoe_31113 [Stentor coeruleus]|uniref:RCC1-like domain-containing protein n=1 Tax=Stentor coeruleus TaxID=5963 RepID=A0A1R2B2C4_9CILI|nr:hypothetical protein SteCoe_31113 [Stentor coeruleus]